MNYCVFNSLIYPGPHTTVINISTDRLNDSTATGRSRKSDQASNLSSITVEESYSKKKTVQTKEYQEKIQRLSSDRSHDTSRHESSKQHESSKHQKSSSSSGILQQHHQTDVGKQEKSEKSKSEKKTTTFLEQEIPRERHHQHRTVKIAPTEEVVINYSNSEAKNYGKYAESRAEKVHRSTNVSNISLGQETAVSSSLYKNEFKDRHKGPCPAALLQMQKNTFKHTRDTPRHKYYIPVVETIPPKQQ